MLVDLEDIAHRLGHTWALRSVSLQVRAGESVAVVGHNGSGKTTLLRVVSTLYSPTRGEGRLAGFDLRTQSDAVRAAVGVLAHASGVYEDLTAAENLSFAMRMCGRPADARRIGDVLDAVGLLRHRDVRVREFSSGMQRRVALARLMLRRASVLLMDEPFNSLDPQGSELVARFIAESCARGAAALVVLHDDARSASLDRVVELRGGAVVPAPERGRALPHLAPVPVARPARAEAGVR